MKRIAALASTLLLLASCGQPGGGLAPGGSGTVSPDAPVSATPAPGPEPTGPGYTLVEPRPGMAGVRPIGFNRAQPLGDGSTLRVIFWSGVEPCSVLDHVEVQETARNVTITLYEGSDPEAGDVACIEIAMKKAVDVTLQAPLEKRAVIDGAEQG